MLSPRLTLDENSVSRKEAHLELCCNLLLREYLFPWKLS